MANQQLLTVSSAGQVEGPSMVVCDPHCLGALVNPRRLQSVVAYLHMCTMYTVISALNTSHSLPLHNGMSATSSPPPSSSQSVMLGSTATPVWQFFDMLVSSDSVLYRVKLKFHWDQFPRNFPVANVTGKSPTSYEEVGRVASLLREVTRKLATFRPSRHVQMVWRRGQLLRN